VVKSDTNLKHSRGQAFLSMVFFIGGIMLVTGITMAVIAAAFIDSGYGAQAADNAETAAFAGIEDAMLQLARNSELTGGGQVQYALASGNYFATVTVGVPTGAGLVTVVSTATVSSRMRKVQAVLSVNPATGQVAVVSWVDVL